MVLKIKKLTDTALLPKVGTNESAGMDLFVDSDCETYINPHETVLLQTNIAVEIPSGYFGAIFARSGLSTKSGLRPATCVSVIDSDYRGSIGLPIHNDSDIKQVVYPHERVAQMIIMPYQKCDIEVVDELGNTDRSVGGFGSTGKN